MRSPVSKNNSISIPKSHGLRSPFLIFYLIIILLCFESSSKNCLFLRYVRSKFCPSTLIWLFGILACV
uniref:Uncharacterized protein n=1 Tax=Lepeophtheirus salmonis TaxID=72036 RepID=A0A0K2T437_LEPSM